MFASVVIGGGGFGVSEFVEVASSILNVVAAGVVALTAFQGLNTWKHEARAKRGMELGVQVLALSYECIDVIRYMRNPWSPASEQHEIVRDEGESEESFQIRRAYAPLFLRYQNSREKFAELLALRYQAEALYTAAHREAIEQVQKLANDLHHAANQAAWVRSQLERDRTLFDRNKDQFTALVDKQHAYEDEVWGMGKEDDRFEPRITETKALIEGLFRSIAIDGEWPPRSKK